MASSSPCRENPRVLRFSAATRNAKADDDSSVMQANSLLGENRRESQGSTSSQLSCAQCRIRKLKCDRKVPICGRCANQKETCSYPDAKQRNLGRRKTVQELEQRIEELESLLRNATLNTRPTVPLEPELHDQSESVFETAGRFNTDGDSVPPLPDLSFPLPALPDAPEVEPAPPLPPDLSFQPSTLSGTPAFTEQRCDELIALDLYEQLPSFDIIDALTDLYFRNVHNGAPMLHRASYIAALRLPPHMRPPMCLQYIVMAAGAATSEAYRHLSDAYYQRARVYAESDELKGRGETFTTVAHVQSWCLISAYECHVYALFTRASTSLCRAVRIAQMLRLHQLDMQTQEPVHVGLPPARTSMEAEERRRTWWVVFLADRYLTSTTGWPSLINDRHIQTNLPASEEAFSTGADEAAVHLSQGLRTLEDGREISSLAVRILAANELLHALDHSSQHRHMRRADPVRARLHWERYRQIERNLSTLELFLPEKLHLSQNPRSLDAILVHVCTNLATMQLYRTALGVLQLQSASSDQFIHSKKRLLSAADKTVAVFRAAGNGVGTAIRNPILSFAAYMAASVFLDDLVASAAYPSDQAQSSQENLNFLAQTLVFFGQSSSLVRANALQLAADMQQAGYDTPMMETILHQIATLGGSVSPILVPGSQALPMFFCPALTISPGSLDPPALNMSMNPAL